MATKAAVPVEEYLQASYPNPDPEYRDGEIVERSVPDYKHGATQSNLAAFFRQHRTRHRLFVAVETRLRVGPRRFMIPDVTVFHPEPPAERFPSSPPLVVIEVLSDDDPMSSVREKLEEYRAWGVRHVWVVDPQGHRLYECDSGLHEVDALRLPDLGLEVTPTDAFD